MRKLNLTLILGLLVVMMGLLLPMEAQAQTLKMDLNGIPMPFCSSFQSDSLYVVSTAYQTVTPPAGAVEVTVWATALCAIGEDASTDAGAHAILPANVPIRMSISRMTALYVRRVATATAATIYFVWHRL